jgi:hypothetical protein
MFPGIDGLGRYRDGDSYATPPVLLRDTGRLVTMAQASLLTMVLAVR